MHKLHILPSQFVEMDDEERAFIIAAIDIRIDAEKKKEAELKSQTGRMH